MGALANPDEIMAKRAAMLLCLIVFLMPVGFGDTDTEDAEFKFARLQYGSGFGNEFFYGRGGGGSWLTDAWDSDYKFMWGIDRMTNVRLSKEPHPVAIMDPDLFQYPYIYAVEVGRMVLSQPEADRLREYLLRGGFWHCDDFWGLGQLRNFVTQIRKVFPDRQLEVLPPTHPIFHSFFDVDHVLQVPNVRNGENYTYTGGRSPTWESRDDTEPRVYGISDDTGRLMVLITYNSDLGDAWEWMDDPDYPAVFTGYAYRLGMNSIIYAMTH
jgi:hypothetical protein